DQASRRVPARDQKHQYAAGSSRSHHARVHAAGSKGTRDKSPNRRGQAATQRARTEELMVAALRVGAADNAVAVLRDTTPFQDASEGLLQRIAAIARPARYGAGPR